MPKGTDVRLGPWPDGINLLDQTDQIQDTQLQLCENFDIDNTGVLIPRRAFKYFNQDLTSLTKYLLGSVILDGETQPRAITNTYDGTNSNLKAINDPTPGTYTSGSHNFVNGRAGLFRNVIQYGGKLWWIPAVSTSVGASSPASLTNPFTAASDIPWGDQAFVLKDRLFIVRKSSSELYFSTPTAFTSAGVFTAPWTGTAPNSGGVIQVSPGDNQPITKVVVLNNQIIIFKRDQTYVLSFTSSPTGDGVLRQVSADQGALDAITYNNEVYCFSSRSVFKFVNGFFQDIGLQLNLFGRDMIDTAATVAKINVVGKTLIVGTTPAGNTYAMNLDTGAWTTYTTPSGLSWSTATITSRSSNGTAVWFGDGTGTLSYMMVTRINTRTVDQGVSDASIARPKYEFRTKELDFDDSETWKRVYSWHLDSAFDGSAFGSAVTYINGAANNTSSDVVDLVGSSLSYRFKRTSMGFTVPATTMSASSVSSLTVRGLRAVIGAKAPVSV